MSDFLEIQIVIPALKWGSSCIAGITGVASFVLRITQARCHPGLYSPHGIQANTEFDKETGLNDNRDEENYVLHKKRTERLLKWGFAFCVVLFLFILYIQLAND